MQVKKVLKPDDKRELIRHITVHFNIGINQACKQLERAKAAFYYEEKPKDGSEIIAALNALVRSIQRTVFACCSIVPESKDMSRTINAYTVFIKS